MVSIRNYYIVRRKAVKIYTERYSDKDLRAVQTLQREIKRIHILGVGQSKLARIVAAVFKLSDSGNS